MILAWLAFGCMVLVVCQTAAAIWDHAGGNAKRQRKALEKIQRDHRIKANERYLGIGQEDL